VSPDSKDIKFPTNHYIGFQTRPAQDGLPLGFMTPDGTDDAAKKRKATVDSWAKGYGYSARNEGALPAKTLENKPMNGFKLGRSLRHGGGGWGQGNVKWRIEDPRGFELEITSPNLAQILACTTVENGEILEQCMWARLKSDNVLVPVSSEVYKAAQANTERLSKTASMADINLGDYAVLHNGTEGTYLGAYFVGSHGFGRYGGTSNVSFEDKKKHLFLQEDGSIYIVASPKLSEIKPTETPLTPVEAERKVLDHIAADGNFNYAGSGYGGPTLVTTVGGKKVMTVERILEPVATADYIAGTAKDASVLMVTTDRGEWGACRVEAINGVRPSYSGTYDFQMTCLKREVFEATGQFQPIQEPRSNYWGGSGLQDKHVTALKSDLVPESHRVRIKATTALGNEIDYIV
jgi:hypothetical protein